MLQRITFTVLFLLGFGIVLSAQTISLNEVAQLEKTITQNPADSETRLKLISYYQQGKTLAAKKSLQKHRVGLIQNNPQTSNYTFFGIWMSENKNNPEYFELKNEWLKQLAKFKTDSKVRLNAGDFLTLAEPLLAEKIFREGETIDPDFFWFPLRLIEIYNSKYEDLKSKGEINEETVKEDDVKPILEKIVAETQSGLKALETADEATKNENERKFLAMQATKSLELGDSKTAYQAAHKLHKNLVETKPQVYLYEYFCIVESVKGRAALMDGNLDEAKVHLFEPIKASQSIGTLPPIIDIRFIEELLIKEGAENILKYLQLCEKLNLEDDDKKIIKKWENLLLKGRIPNFSEYRNTIENILIL
ncbi:MAG: hypothetical protein ABJA66_14320 [Actinomycetota bacterium]